MSFFFEFKNISSKRREEVVKDFISDSSPDQEFFIILTLSTMMATLGLLLDDAVIVLASALIAPLLFAFLSLGLGLAISDSPLVIRSMKTIVKSFFISIITSIIIVVLFGSLGDVRSGEIFARSDPSLLFLFVSIVASFAIVISAFKSRNSFIYLASAALSTSLIPPASVIGIGIAILDFSLIRGSLLLFIVNVFGIIFSSIILFSIFNLKDKKRLADELIVKENIRIQRDKIIAERLEKKENSIVNVKEDAEVKKLEVKNLATLTKEKHREDDRQMMAEKKAREQQEEKDKMINTQSKKVEKKTTPKENKKEGKKPQKEDKNKKQKK